MFPDHTFILEIYHQGTFYQNALSFALFYCKILNVGINIVILLQTVVRHIHLKPRNDPAP